jgi:hypothetical protein
VVGRDWSASALAAAAAAVAGLCMSGCAEVRDADTPGPGPILLQPDLGQGRAREVRDRAACEAWAADVSGGPVPDPVLRPDGATVTGVEHALSSLARLRNHAYVGALLECLERRGYTP